MEKSSSLIMQEEWNKLIDKLQIHLEQKQYHFLNFELKLAAAILQQEVSSQLLATLSEANICFIKNCLITVGQAADEKDYRDQFHKTLLAQWHKILINKNADLAKYLIDEIRHKAPSSIMVKPRYHFSHDFNALYAANASANPYQTLKSEQEARLTRLEGSLERNRYAVYAEIIVTYMRCLIRARHNITNEHLVALGTFIESLSYIAVTQQTGHEELWHYLLPLQTDLADELIYAHYQSFMDPAHLLAWQHTQRHKVGESLLLLQTVAYTLSLSKDLSEQKLLHWLQALNTFIDTCVAHQPPKLTCELLQTEQHQHALAQYRKGFVNSEANFIEAQKLFSTLSLALLNQLTHHMAQLLGESPCEWALCATGSSARLDRRPYSDVELMLLYQAKPTVSANHLQTYLYLLLSGLEIAIKQLGETHYEYTQNVHADAGTAGFHLDSSCHILREELFGTPQAIVAQYFYNTLPRKQASDETGNEWHDWLHNRKFYALLLPKLVIGNADLFNLYLDEVKQFLTVEVSASNQLEKLAKILAMPAVFKSSLRRHQAIALSCLAQVLQESQQQLMALKAGEVINLKDMFYKPLTYLALNLKLSYGLTAEHPAEIYAEAAAKLPWGASEVVTLLQAALSYIGQLQMKLHLKHGYQEECCVWLGQGNQTQAAVLTAQDYVGLSLLKKGLLLPLCQRVKKQLNAESFAYALVEVLPYLLKSYLATRNEPWLHRWTQHASHSLPLVQLLAHPLISVLADYPSPNGWSPTYEQTMRRWLGQLQTLMSEHKTTCLIEGIPTAKQKTSYLPQEIVTQLFDAKGEFKGNVHHSAQSKVSQIAWQVPGQAKPITFYFKVKPGNEAGLMGREFAVIDLHQLLGGQSHIASGWPLKLTYITAKGPKIYYCWVSEGVPGESLAKVMQNEKAFADLNAHLDRQSYSHLFITHYLTCPEDAQPDNFKVVEHSKKNKKVLYGLDVGQSFVGTHDDKRKVLVVKTMLYLLEPAINQVLDNQVLTQFMLLEPKALIKHWQVNLKRMNQLFKPLFEDELAKTRVPKAQWCLHNQLIDLNETVQLSVEKRLELLLNWLYQPSQKEKSCALLLRTLEPAVALSYQSLRGKIKTPEDFYKIDPKAYVKNPNTGKMYSSTTYANIQQQTLTPERLQASLNLGEEYFAAIDFRKIKDQVEQRYVLALLQAAIKNKKSFSYLNLSGCTVISEKELFELLQKLPAIKELHLEDCSQFNLSTLFQLLSFKVNEKLGGFRWEYEVLCPQLRKLTMTIAAKTYQVDISLSLVERKQLVTLVTQKLQQVEFYRKKLLNMLSNKERNVQVAGVESLGKLAGQLSSTQAEKVIEALLVRLTDENRDVREATAQSLRKLAGQLLSAQVEKVVKTFFDWLGDESWSVRKAAIKSLGQLAAQLSAAQVPRIVEVLLAQVGNEDSGLRMVTVKCLVQLAARLSSTQTEKVAEALLARLRDKDSFVRETAVKSLGQLAAQLSSAQVPRMVEALLVLGDNDRNMQEAAAESLVRIVVQLSTAQAEKVVDKLLTQLEYEYSSMRATVVLSLEKLAVQLSSTQGPKIIESLLAQMGNEDSYLRTAAVKSLVQLAAQLSSAQAEKVAEALLIQLEDIDPDVRAKLIESLVPFATRILAVQADNLVEALLAQLRDQDWHMREATVKDFGLLAARLTPVQVETVVKALLYRLGYDNKSVRAVAAESLGRLAILFSSTQAETVAKALLKQLGDEYWCVRNEAAQLLGLIAAQLSLAQAEKVAEALIAQMEDIDTDVQAKVIESLVPFATRISAVQAQRVVEALLNRLEDKDLRVRAAALQSLVPFATRILAVQVEKLVEALLAQLRDEDWHVRAVATKNLEQLTARLSVAQVETMVKALLDQLRDEYSSMRAVAIKSLVQLAARLPVEQVETVVTALLDRLKDENLYVLVVATKNLGQLAAWLSMAQVETVVNALLDRLGDRNWDVRRAVLNSLAEFFSPASLLQWLQRSLLQIDETVFKQLPESSVPINQSILFKLFSYLDPKTLLQVIPQVNKDWRRWQKVYLQQQAEQQRLQFALPSEENNNDNDAKETMPENSFNRFLL